MRGDGRVYRRKRMHWISYYRDGVEHRESSGCRCLPADTGPCKTALGLLRQRLAEVRTRTWTAPKVARTTVGEVIDAYLTNCVTRRVKSLTVTLGDDGQPVYSGAPARALGHARDAFGDRKVIDLTDEAIERWANAMTAAGAAPAYVQLRLAFFNAALQLAKRRRIVAEIPNFPAIEVRNTRQGFFEAGDFWRAHATLRDPVADMAHLAYVIGWRRDEIRTLTWPMVHRDARELRLPDSKNGHPRVVPLAGEVAAIIERRWKARAIGCAHVFHRNGKRLRPETVSREFSRACARVGLAGWRFHDLRRTASRNMRALGIDPYTVMKLMGHRSESMARRYAIDDTRSMAAALDRVAVNADTTRTV